MRAGLLAVLLLWPLHAADPGARIRQALAASPAAQAAFWGIQVTDASTGRSIWSLNPDRLFVPASNTKLFTIALALNRLGRDFRFHTRVLAAAAPDASGTVEGPLVLVGGGDPNLSGRAVPYRKNDRGGDALAAIDDLADQVAARGVRRVRGEIVGDDTIYEWEPFPEGWAADDNVWEYGAAVSALVLNDGAFKLSVRPGEKPGDAARIAVSPPVEYYVIDNRVVTAASGERKIEVDRTPGSRQLRVWGTIPAGNPGTTELLGVDEPARYAAVALREALMRRGITVDGGAAARHRFRNQPEPFPPPSGVELARRTSAPLVEDLKITAKVSQNLHAELALRAVALARRGTGSRSAGIEELKVFLTQAGIPREAYEFNDGSGLTRLNLVTPAAVTRLLLFMYASPARADWIDLLPVAGEDGTLDKRFLRTPAAGRIRAKTGTLSHVSALSGYADRKDGRRYAFAILVNNYRGPDAEIRKVIDRICNALLE